MRQTLLLRLIIHGDLLKKLFLILILLLLASPCLAASNYYISKDCANNGDGSSWSCAAGAGQAGAFNELPTPGTSHCNFDAYTWVLDSTYWVAGSDTSYGNICFRNTSGSGTLTLQKATAATNGTDTGWVAGYGTKVATMGVIGSHSDFTAALVIDGATGGGPGAWETGHGFNVYQENAGGSLITVPSASTTTIKRVRAHFAGSETSTGEGTILYSGTAKTGLTVQYVYFHDAPCDIAQIRATTNLTVEYSKFARNKSESAGCHGDVFEHDGTGSNHIFRYNWFEDVEGTYMLGHHSTGNLTGLEIYGNLITWSDTVTYDGFSNGIIGTINPGDGGVVTGAKVYNNTFYNLPAGTTSKHGVQLYVAGSDGVAYNNLWDTCAGNPVSFSDTVTHTHNWYRACGTSPTEDNKQDGSGNPFTNVGGKDFTLSSPTTTGTTLLSPYNIDMLGNTRGADSVWDRGAYEYTAGGASTTSFGGGTFSGCSFQ